MDPDETFSSPGWDIILSYLTLADLENVSQSNSKLRKIMESYLGRGNTLLIDRDTLLKYPIQSRKALYTRYGSLASNLVIDGVYHFDIDPLFDCFPKIRELTVNRAWVLLNNTSLITTLCIIKPPVDRIDLDKFKNLETLFLQECPPITLRLPRLKSLAAIGTELNYFSDYYNLRELTVDFYTRVRYNKLSQLEHLKITQSVDPKHREAIEALNLKTVDVHYFHVPTEDTPIKRLNEDCFLYLREFLSANDWISLRDTLWCLQEQKIPKFTVNKETLLRRPLPLYTPFYARIGPFITQLELYNISSEDVCEVLPHFDKLNDLTLRNNSCESAEQLRSIFKIIGKGLRSFYYYDDNQLPQPELNDLMRRLNPTLETLLVPRICRELTQSLRELQNIRNFECDDVELTINEAFLFFLKVNSAHMVRLSLRHCLPTENAELWSTIAQMQSLETLEINSNITIPELPLYHVHLPKLRQLSLLGLNCVRKFLSSLDGSALIELHLEQFLTTRDVQEILRFQQLRKLECILRDSEDLLLLIKGLPQLIKVIILKMNIPNDILRDIRTYLRYNSRRLHIEYSGNLIDFNM